MRIPSSRNVQFEEVKGLRVLLVSHPALHMTTAGLFIDAGFSQTESHLRELPHLVEHLILAPDWSDPMNLTACAEMQGWWVNGQTHEHETAYLMASANHPAADLTDALCQIVFLPRIFPREQVEREFQIIRSERKSRERDLTQRLLLEVRQTLYPSWQRGQTQAAIPDHEQVTAWMQRWHRPSHALLVVQGNGMEALASSLAGLAEQFPTDSTTTGLASPITQLEPVAGSQKFVDQNGAFAIAAAVPLPPYSAPDHLPMAMILGLLVHGMGARLYRRLVLEEALTYQVHTDLRYDQLGGSAGFVVRVRDSRDLARTKTILTEELNALLERPIAQVELERARSRYITHLAATLDDPVKGVLLQGRHTLRTGHPLCLTDVARLLQTLHPADVAETWKRVTQGKIAWVEVQGKERTT